jgi:glycosyltransferase involved in cell wall biosynthesis
MSIDKLQQNRLDLQKSSDRLQQILSEMHEMKKFSSQAPPKKKVASQAPPETKKRQSIFFYRDFLGLTGGHLKVWHYFNYIISFPEYIPYIYFSQKTVWDASNPWLNIDKKHRLFQPLSNPDIIFMEGMDWEILDEKYKHNSPVPIINLIQHIRHSFSDNPRYPFLQHKAIRICVSEEVKSYLEKTGRVNGPLFTIPCSIDLEQLPLALPYAQKKDEILIAAFKEPELGRQLKQQLEVFGKPVKLLTSRLLRKDYLELVNRAKLTIFLPNQKEGEGFYLPALEGMALGCLVICPDCIGNRSFCLQGHNCFRPDYDIDSIINAVKIALGLSPGEAERMLAKARVTASQHSLMAEKEGFFNILTKVRELW